jgi:hypothetical protein
MKFVPGCCNCGVVQGPCLGFSMPATLTGTLAGTSATMSKISATANTFNYSGQLLLPLASGVTLGPVGFPCNSHGAGSALTPIGYGCTGGVRNAGITYYVVTCGGGLFLYSDGTHAVVQTCFARYKLVSHTETPLNSVWEFDVVTTVSPNLPPPTTGNLVFTP